MQEGMRGLVCPRASHLHPRPEYLPRVIEQGQPTLIGELQAILPCKEHSGLVADVKHLIKGNEEIKGVLNELWGAVNELRKELRNR